MMLGWLPRPASARARAVPGDRAQVIVTDEPDPAVDALVARSAAALDSIAGWAEDKIDALITALAAQIAAETGWARRGPQSGTSPACRRARPRLAALRRRHVRQPHCTALYGPDFPAARL